MLYHFIPELLRVFEIFSSFEKQRGVHKQAYKSCYNEIHVSLYVYIYIYIYRQRYLLDCHYQEEKVNRAFFKAFKIKGHLGLVGKKETDHNCKPKINFVTDFDPMFPDINKILNKHKHILLEDEQCKKLFTENCFRVTHRRGHKNLKEWLAPSNVISREINPVSHDELNPGCKKCGKYGKNPRGRKR